MSNLEEKRRVEKLIDQLARCPGSIDWQAPDAEAIERFRREATFDPPPEWLNWLSICNGASLIPGERWVAAFYGIAPTGRSGPGDVSRVFFMDKRGYFEPWRERRWVPLGNDGCGDYFMYGHIPELADPVVFFWEQNREWENVEYVIATDLWIFLRCVLERKDEDQVWPFDESETLRIDPGLAQLPAHLLPWNDQ